MNLLVLQSPRSSHLPCWHESLFLPFASQQLFHSSPSSHRKAHGIAKPDFKTPIYRFTSSIDQNQERRFRSRSDLSQRHTLYRIIRTFLKDYFHFIWHLKFKYDALCTISPKQEKSTSSNKNLALMERFQLRFKGRWSLIPYLQRTLELPKVVPEDRAMYAFERRMERWKQFGNNIHSNG